MTLDVDKFDNNLKMDRAGIEALSCFVSIQRFVKRRFFTCLDFARVEIPQEIFENCFASFKKIRND